MNQTQFLQDLIDHGTAEFDWEQVGPHMNLRQRTGKRIYDLDGGYSSGAVWVALTWRRAGKPNKDTLMKWSIDRSTVPSGGVPALLVAVKALISANEQRLRGDDAADELLGQGAWGY